MKASKNKENAMISYFSRSKDNGDLIVDYEDEDDSELERFVMEDESE